MGFIQYLSCCRGSSANTFGCSCRPVAAPLALDLQLLLGVGPGLVRILSFLLQLVLLLLLLSLPLAFDGGCWLR